MSSTEPPYTQKEQDLLLTVANDSIEHGLRTGVAKTVDVRDFPEKLQAQRASFVTLHKQDELRGCIGTLSAIRPLVDDVSHNAFAAAFEDPRFPPLMRNELAALTLSISILSTPEPLEISSEQDLLKKIRPGIDGLILSEGYRRGTFLPSVWESLPDPVQFVQHLKIKAGLPADYWSDRIKIEKYVTFSFPK
jgi:AmmeMemoRadiSam system protein A